mmetsp:Transcript_9946/g.17077  ORF Transcript_9946/g.17077 Transcript_9946/m.17077 type:complete len:108 (-) Transcript_9946:144-467(-)
MRRSQPTPLDEEFPRHFHSIPYNLTVLLCHLEVHACTEVVDRREAQTPLELVLLEWRTSSTRFSSRFRRIRLASLYRASNLPEPAWSRLLSFLAAMRRLAHCAFRIY